MVPYDGCLNAGLLVFSFFFFLPHYASTGATQIHNNPSDMLNSCTSSVEHRFMGCRGKGQPVVNSVVRRRGGAKDLRRLHNERLHPLSLSLC